MVTSWKLVKFRYYGFMMIFFLLKIHCFKLAYWLMFILWAIDSFSILRSGQAVFTPVETLFSALRIWIWVHCLIKKVLQFYMVFCVYQDASNRYKSFVCRWLPKVDLMFRTEEVDRNSLNNYQWLETVPVLEAIKLRI